MRRPEQARQQWLQEEWRPKVQQVLERLQVQPWWEQVQQLQLAGWELPRQQQEQKQEQKQGQKHQVPWRVREAASVAGWAPTA